MKESRYRVEEVGGHVDSYIGVAFKLMDETGEVIAFIPKRDTPEETRKIGLMLASSPELMEMTRDAMGAAKQAWNYIAMVVNKSDNKGMKETVKNVNEVINDGMKRLVGLEKRIYGKKQ